VVFVDSNLEVQEKYGGETANEESERGEIKEGGEKRGLFHVKNLRGKVEGAVGKKKALPGLPREKKKGGEGVFVGAANCGTELGKRLIEGGQSTLRWRGSLWGPCREDQRRFKGQGEVAQYKSKKAHKRDKSGQKELSIRGAARNQPL